MNSIARNSPMSGELNVISFKRAMICWFEVGVAWRSSGDRYCDTALNQMPTGEFSNGMNENNLSTALRCVSGRLPPWFHRVPEIGEPPARPLGTAAGESVRKHDRVHRTGRSALTFTGQP